MSDYQFFDQKEKRWIICVEVRYEDGSVKHYNLVEFLDAIGLKKP